MKIEHMNFHAHKMWHVSLHMSCEIPQGKTTFIYGILTLQKLLALWALQAKFISPIRINSSEKVLCFWCNPDSCLIWWYPVYKMWAIWCQPMSLDCYGSDSGVTERRPLPEFSLCRLYKTILNSVAAISKLDCTIFHVCVKYHLSARHCLSRWIEQCVKLFLAWDPKSCCFENSSIFEGLQFLAFSIFNSNVSEVVFEIGFSGLWSQVHKDSRDGFNSTISLPLATSGNWVRHRCILWYTERRMEQKTSAFRWSPNLSRQHLFVACS